MNDTDTAIHVIRPAQPKPRADHFACLVHGVILPLDEYDSHVGRHHGDRPAVLQFAFADVVTAFTSTSVRRALEVEREAEEIIDLRQRLADA